MVYFLNFNYFDLIPFKNIIKILWLHFKAEGISFKKNFGEIVNMILICLKITYYLHHLYWLEFSLGRFYLHRNFLSPNVSCFVYCSSFLCTSLSIIKWFRLFFSPTVDILSNFFWWPLKGHQLSIMCTETLSLTCFLVQRKVNFTIYFSYCLFFDHNIYSRRKSFHQITCI